jgi:outer membrane protein assembly factor BamB
MRRMLLLIALPLCLHAAAGLKATPPADGWSSFRGPSARGFLTTGPAVPAAWDAESGENVRWKTRIPGLGHSSPVIAGERVFVTTAISGRDDADLRIGLYGDIAPVDDDSIHRWMVYCLNRRTGEILWERLAHSGVPKVRRHTKATHANSTPATDGNRVVAFFGSEGLFCYDVDGELLWKKDFGVIDSGYFQVPAAQWGFASSPVIHGDRVIVQCDSQKDGFLAALRLSDGEELWRTPRNDVPTWSTPTILAADGRSQVIVNGYQHIGGYDLGTGTEVWRLRGGGDIPVPTPVIDQGLIFITNAHGRMAPIYAVRVAAKGDISLSGDETSNEHIAWSTHRDGAYMQTPLVYGNYLYVCKDNGVLACYDARTGERQYQERLSSGRTGFTASPVASDGKLFYTAEDGDVYVVAAGPEFRLLGTNPLGEIALSTPAIFDGTLFFRTRDHMVAIGR